MAIETLNDIIEELANGLGIYGSCEHNDEEHDDDSYCCRIAFAGMMRSRIEAAVKVEFQPGSTSELVAHALEQVKTFEASLARLRDESLKKES